MSQLKPNVEEGVSQNNSVENNDKALIKSLIKCLNFATEAHKNQKRKDVKKTPYINHPIGVAHIISIEAKMPNLDLLMASLLHDTVEDTIVDIGDIRTEFGDSIGDLIAELTDDKTLPKEKRKELQITKARNLSSQAKIVKLADLIYNLRDLENQLPEGWSEERRDEYFKWAFEVCKGLRGTNFNLERELDILFRNKDLLVDDGEPSEETFDFPSWTRHDKLICLMDAADYAAKLYSSHTTLNGLPYINHAVMVAYILSEEANTQDSTELCAALLCGIVGKAGVPKVVIEVHFGIDVAKLVSELTYDHSGCLETQYRRQMLQANKLSYSAKMIKLAVMLSNYRLLKTREYDMIPMFEDLGHLRYGKKLCERLAGTHYGLEQQLNHIFANRGFRF